MKIFGWLADNSGCGHYRVALPLAEYVRRGGDATWSEVMPKWAATDADVIIGQRVCKDGPTTLWQSLCRTGRALMVLELDDDLFRVDHSNTPAHNFYQPGILDNLAQNIRASDVVTVTTDALADMVKAYNTNVMVVPNRIPAWLLSHQRPTRANLTIGWGGGASHRMDWEDAAPQVARFLWRNEDVRAHMIGAMFEAHRNWPLDRVTFTGWRQSVDDYYRTVDFDIGLAPLRPHLFNQSKSPIKALEYAALGIPVVASATGPYEQFVQHGVTGYLVRRDHEWTSFLKELSGDADLRHVMATNARELASRNTVESNLGSWLAAWQVPAPTQEMAA